MSDDQRPIDPDDDAPLSPADEAHVHDLLAALPDPEVPDDVEARIAAALASPEPSSTATVLPGRRRTGATASPTSPTGRWRNPHLLQAAAVIVILALVGAAGWGIVAARSDDGAAPATVAGGAEGTTATAPITTSGTPYTASNLNTAVRTLLGASPVAAAAAAEPDGANSLSTKQLATGTDQGLVALVQDPTTRQKCLDQLSGTPGEQALAIDVGSFNGKPAAVIVLPGTLDQNKVDVWVVGATCSDADNPFPYQFQQVPRP